MNEVPTNRWTNLVLGPLIASRGALSSVSDGAAPGRMEWIHKELMRREMEGDLEEFKKEMQQKGWQTEYDEWLKGKQYPGGFNIKDF